MAIAEKEYTVADAIKEMYRVWSTRLEELKTRCPEMSLAEMEKIVGESMNKELDAARKRTAR